MSPVPRVRLALETHASKGVRYLTDPALFARAGIRVAFSSRTGGVSAPPYDSLNLAGHVGDDAEAVDENRLRFLGALGLSGLRERLVTAEQVHGEAVAVVDDADAGRGAFAALAPDAPAPPAPAAPARPPVPATDALITATPDLPLLMLFADCVPVVLVSEAPRAVAVVHAGWRGALASLPGTAATALAGHAGVAPSEITAHIGPHIGACCYEVDATLLSRFANTFDTIAAVDGRLDLAAAVTESLMRAGVREEAIVSAGACTLDHAEEYFSYRASATTGRHGALAVITKVG